MQQLRQSETRTIRRSQINLNPVNPKRHTSDSVNLQKKNLKKVGYLGGIVWNETTGNLIDGHRRVMAMDLYYKYDGTPETDYDIKVEVVQLDEKAEKEQLTYMAVGNTKADIDLIANYIGEIDYSDVGLTIDQMNEILATASYDQVNVPDILGDLLTQGNEEKKDEEKKTPEKTREEKIAHVKDVKAKTAQMAQERSEKESAYITLSFTSYDRYLDLCEILGLEEGAKFAKGESVLELIS